MKKILGILILALVFPIGLWAENANPDIRKGNRLYKKEKFTESETEYRKGLLKDNKSVESAYNLGNSLYNQGKYKEAADAFKGAATMTQDKSKLSSIYHNMGNAYYKAQDYGQSVDAYKKSLKNNPKDDETRYNLALAQKKMQEQQQNQQNQNQQNQEQQQDQQQQQQQEQQQEQQDKQDQQEQQQQQQQNQDQMDKETAEQILNAFQQEEDDTQDKLQQKPAQRSLEKDW